MFHKIGEAMTKWCFGIPGRGSKRLKRLASNFYVGNFDDLILDSWYGDRPWVGKTMKRYLIIAIIVVLLAAAYWAWSYQFN